MRTKIINQPDDFFKLISNPAIELYGVLYINEDVLVVNYASVDAFILQKNKKSSTSNQNAKIFNNEYSLPKIAK